MMDFLEWCGRHWFLALVGMYLGYCIIRLPFSLAATLYRRALRTLMVALRGWPPEHLDADGDWKPESAETES